MVLGDIHRGRGDAAAAVAAYRRAIEVGKHDAEAHTAVAQALMDAGRAGEASEWADLALGLAPRDPEALFTRARVAAAQGRDDAARRDLDDAVAAGGERFRERARQDERLRPLLR
jgi:tetratricopeptide (TPR) repeat protein